MKRVAIALGCALAVAACQPVITDDDIDSLKNDIRQAAEQQGLTVKQINLRKESNDRVVGDATVAPRDNPSGEIRWDCSAQREEGTRLQWRCAPPNQAASAGSNTTPAPAPAPAPVATPAPAPAGSGRAAFVGRWTDTNDCNTVTLLGEDGVFIAPNGARGNWNVQGQTLTLSGPGGQVSWTVFLNDPNTMTLTSPDGSQSQSTRC
jgi:hypothetical protein